MVCGLPKKSIHAVIAGCHKTQLIPELNFNTFHGKNASISSHYPGQSPWAVTATVLAAALGAWLGAMARLIYVDHVQSCEVRELIALQVMAPQTISVAYHASKRFFKHSSFYPSASFIPNGG